MLVTERPVNNESDLLGRRKETVSKNYEDTGSSERGRKSSQAPHEGGLEGRVELVSDPSTLIYLYKVISTSRSKLEAS